MTLTGANTISSGGILVTSNVGANGAAIAGGGSLTSGNGADIIVNQFDSSGTLTIGAQLTGGVALTKSGSGTLALTNSANDYSGGTTLNGGLLTISADGNLGSPSGGVTLIGGSIQAAGVHGTSFTIGLNRGFALGPTIGVGNGTVDVASANTVTIAGAIANNGASSSSLTKTGPGTLILANAGNSFSGGLIINQGIVTAAVGGDIGAATNPITFTGSAVLQFTSINAPFQHNIVAGAGAIATIDNTNASGAGNFIDSNGRVLGPGGFTYMSSIGTTAFSSRLEFNPSSGSNNEFSGPMTIYDSNLYLLLSGTTNSPVTRYNATNVLNLGGHTNFQVTSPPGGGGAVQTLGTFTNLIADTSSQIAGSAFTSGTQFFLNSVSSGGLVRNSGSTLNVNSVGAMYIANGAATNSNGILGGWATFGGTDWATLGTGGVIAQYSGYVSDTWAAGNNTTVTLASHTSDALTTNSLQFGAAAANTVNLSSASSAAPNVITSGGILLSANVGGNASAITGGFLTSGNGSDVIIDNYNTTAGGALTITSAIVNNGATAIGVTLGGNPIATGEVLILTNPANAYTGPTVANAATTIQAGAANVIPATSAVILSMLATFDMHGFDQSIGSLANFNGSLSVLSGINFGYGASVVGNGAVTLTIGGDSTSTVFNGGLLDGAGTLSLVKVGTGTLTLGNFNDNNPANTNLKLTNYSGGTTITAGTLDIVYDADLGAVPGGPATNITFNGNAGAPALQFNSVYQGTSLSTNRSIAVNTNSVGYIDTNGNPLITYAGLVTVGGSGTFGKAGAGTFELDAPPTFTAGGNLVVSGGTLRLKYGSPATFGGTVTGAVANGATLELAGSVSQLSQMVNIANAGTLLDSSSANQNVGAVTSTGNTVVNTGGSLTAYETRQNSLTVTGNAKVTLLPSGSGSNTTPAAPNNINFSSNVGSLSIGGTANAWTGTLDIGNNGLVIQYGAGSDPFTNITNMVKSGYENGNWTGTGITSSMARAAVLLGSPTPALNIGLVDFIPNTGTFGSSISFEGQTISTSAVLVRLTYMDDLVLSGDMAQANATSDALFFAANYGSGTVWHVGDITHDGVIDTNDALLFAANYVVGLPSLDGTTGNAAALGRNAVPAPEPASALLAALGLLGLRAVSAGRRKTAGPLPTGT